MSSKPTPSKPSSAQYATVVGSLVLFSIAAGYISGIQPTGEWRFFSWHPFLMTCGMVGLAGIGAITKKLGGYTNTKLHGILGWASILVSLGGLYCIYRNKEINGYNHLKSPHAWCGLGVSISSIGLGLAGGIFLHPDFGIDKTNKLIRKVHKLASRATLILAWMTALAGLFQLTSEPMIIAMYALPLVALVPFTLL